MIYRYSYDNAIGVVIADSESEAHKKVLEAYIKHSDANETSEITIMDFAFEGHFDDCPDVFEVYSFY